MGGAKFCRFALFPLMLLMLLFVPTRMVAQSTTEDPRYALFNGLDGINNVTITDNGDHPWQMLDLNAEGMTNLGFTIPEGSKGLMSSNYNVDGSSSETVVNFTVEKPMLLTFKYLVSSEYFDKATITLDNKEPWMISEIMQIGIKALLSVGKHSLKLSYTKDESEKENADRTCIYDLKTATTFSEYVADYVATNSTLTFKKITSDNLEGLDLSRMAVVDNIDMVQNVCTNYSSIKNIVFDESFKTYALTSLSEFFGGCETLETISGLEYLNTANVTDMSHMFHGCSALKSLDLTNFNTANVTDMSHMFHGCSALESLDLTKFNTANVEFMYHMFYGCSALKSLDLTNFNTAKVTDMSSMFYGCSALKSLDLTNFNTAKVTNMSNMFKGCSALTSLGLTNFNTAKVTDMGNMFNGCFALTSLDLTNFNTANVEFMDYMFNGCFALKSLDLTNFNTAKVTYMNNMFEGCSALTTIYASDKFVTDNVSHGLDMFTGCESLKDYSDSKTDHTYANYGTTGYFTPVFDYAEFDNATGTLTFRRGLSKPAGAYDLNMESNNPGWEAQKRNIKKVVFDASFANARPTSCCWWFGNCFDLTEIDGIENLNTQNVTDMRDMFVCCYALTSLDVSNFNTQNVEDMTDMFLGCEGLSLLDLSNFNTERVENMSSMFSGCSTLQTIFASDKFVTDQVFGGDDMFIDCENLKGFIDYISNPDKTDKTYANYTTGYFTKLVGKNGEKKIGAAGEALTTENLILEDGKDFVAYDQFAAKNAFYIRVIPEGSTWGTLCLPFAIDQSQETECKFYRLTGIDADNKCITLEGCEEGKIPAGTPVLFKMNKGVQTLNISVQDAGIVKEPVAGTNTDVKLVGSFTKIGGNDNQGLAENDYIIGKDRFWLVSELKKDGKGVGIKPMRAYIHPANEYQARAAMLSIGKGDGTTAIDNLNAISNDANAEYYDANGRRTNGLQKGLNIVKRGSKTYKIMVK
ncbi:BspA family leucine-rich repeat surface protein [Prevotella copri]|uniref:BspA family leucine-rich repeat surface protein n=1 Tax=Segatella copri TaxID=165179 RepID=A0AAW5IS84_9BACT|nr:BspA family leucine-rich repeat surface protein [Segatella copri]MCP9553147.1 BspA family leucine-rich repeat surface protein [Segatella copri]MCP9576909.1 BspA family leucine-rich repeat surface protein [Segatella copri]MCP9579818.1 BspA family leucine-rich repeat surface protein [Segatella copri]MCP9582717.1 BspA family leucine-rich repeat surface protein [Segatella copri]MCP9585669.1 BspA family leucine-rich repeat surface protein [Segatella copri]